MNDEYNPSEGEDHQSDNETDPVEGEGKSKLSQLSDRQLLYQEFDSLVTQICQESSNSWQRKRLLNQLVTKMKNSGLIWKDNVPYYEDALQEQWEFFCSNLCESRTGTQYDRDRGNVITWFNYYLKRRLQNWALRVDRDNSRRDDREQFLEDGTPIDRIDILPAEDETHIIECMQFFEEVQSWIETNPDGVLNEYIRGRKDLTCQVILRSLSSGQGFTTIAAECGCVYATIYGFYRNKCRPHLQKFREKCGY
ncbi:MAG: sigma-70 family RNA polymerase sigma factor [Microcoleus sp. CSU_2_2]|nr:sigma-70 family RNA polymerase sigma factor [Microcoleus sp. SU_5_3]NJS12942.1 sigma-70 family RNA polymerase sigma factor [Microcoleus sp. CSU_2_2]